MRFIFPIAAAAALAACQSDKPEFKQIGYFKGESRNRVFVLEAKTQVSTDEALAAARRKMHTDRQMTVVLIYEPDTAPDTDTISVQRDFQSAMERAMAPPFNGHRYYYSKAPTGAETFMICDPGPTPDAPRACSDVK